MSAFTLVELTPNAIMQAFGPAGCLYEQSVLNAMKKTVVGYSGGSFELRRYVNGAHMLILADKAIHEIAFGPGSSSMSLEGASMFANCLVSAQLCQHYYDLDNEEQNTFFHDLAAAQRQAISNCINFVLDKSAPGGEGYRDLNEDEKIIVKQSSPHPDSSIIDRLMD